MSTTNTPANGVTKPASTNVAEYIAEQQRLATENDELRKQVAALQAGSKTNISASCKKYGKGTVSVTGVGGRFPESFHPVQWPRMQEGVQAAKVYISNSANHDTIRSSAFAFEMACKIMQVTKAPEDSTPKSAARTTYEQHWDKAFALAMTDKTLVPANPKYVNPAQVASDWK